MNSKLFISVFLFSFVLFSCNHKENQDNQHDTALSTFEMKEAPPRNQKEKLQIPVGNINQHNADSTVTQLPTTLPTANTDWDKKIIKNAIVHLEVKDFKKYNETIHKTIRRFGGYIAQEEHNLTEEKSETVLAIKVPVEQFEILMNNLQIDDAKILQRKIASEDVTVEVIDTRSRLEAKKQARLKYLDFLKASKNMEEVLQVQAEINSLQEQIEAAAGRVAYLSHHAAYSTIQLTFYQPAIGFKPIDSNPSLITRLIIASRSGAMWLTELLIAMITIWPAWLVLIGGIVGYKKMKSLKVTP